MELGALVVSIYAGSMGWDAHYLGPDLPAEEIAAAARWKGARAVVLSILYRDDATKLAQEVERLRSLLDPGTQILAGGPGAVALQGMLPNLPDRMSFDLRGLRAALDDLLRGRD